MNLTLQDYWELPTGEVELELEVGYYPGRPARIRYDDWDYPAEPPEAELQSAKARVHGKWVDVTLLAEGVYDQGTLIERCAEALEDYRDAA